VKDDKFIVARPESDLLSIPYLPVTIGIFPHSPELVASLLEVLLEE